MDASRQLAVLADPTRRQIFEILLDAPSSVGEIAGRVPVSRPAVSQHLRALVDSGFVTATAHGRRRIYRADPSGLGQLRNWVEALWDRALGDAEDLAWRRVMGMDEAVRPVVKTCTVPLAPDEAFVLFTERMADWWPTATHSISADRGDGGFREIRVEGRVGGRVVEVVADGEYAWAEFLAWEPPVRFVLSWHPAVEPTAASRVEVQFRATEVGTEVRLEHTGWEEFGAQAAVLRESYDAGWGPVIRRFVDATA